MDDKIPSWLKNLKEPNSPFMDDPSSYLGSLIFSFQELEYALVELLGDLIKNIDYARIIATETSFRKLLNIIESIMQQNKINRSTINTFQNCKKEILKVEQERNKYVHSYYEIIEWSGNYIKYLRMKTRNKSGLKTMTETIDDDKSFTIVTDKIIELIIKIRDIQIE